MAIRATVTLQAPNHHIHSTIRLELQECMILWARTMSTSTRKNKHTRRKLKRKQRRITWVHRMRQSLRLTIPIVWWDSWNQEACYANTQYRRWWFATTLFPLIAGTFGPMASTFSLCALIEHWRLIQDPTSTETEGQHVSDPSWWGTKRIL